MNIESCRKGEHDWNIIYDNGNIWNDEEFTIKWCKICGTYRTFTTFDRRNPSYLDWDTPSFVKNL